MTIPSRSRSRLLSSSILIALMLGSAGPAAASAPARAVKARPVPVVSTTPAKVPARPWLYENSDVPIDAAWRFGTLPNGLRYAIRRNGVPPGQVSIRLRVDVGSLMEQPDELGFAHYMEHLTFRGSRHVPDGESKRIWQRLGVTFGSDSNAQTTPTGTTYALDLPEATSDTIDESLKILAGMMAEPNIIPASVDAERAVVLAEMREGTSSASKAGDAARAFFFAGQPLATRSPIGTSASLEAARADRLIAFHNRWYRPERTVISVAGDVDPAVMEAALKRSFSGWKGVGAAAPLPDFGRPDPKAPDTLVLVQPGVPASVSLAWLRPWQPKADTIAYNQRKLRDIVALQIVNHRLEEAARTGKASFLAASITMDDVSRSVDGTFISISPGGGGWEKAIADVRGIVADALATPPSQAEIDRDFAQLDTALAIEVENEDTQAASKQATDLVMAVDIRETTVAPQVALDIYRSARPGMTPEGMLESTRRMFAGDAVRAMVAIPEPDATAAQRLTAAMAAPAVAPGDIRVAATSVTMDDLPSLGKPGRVVSRTRLPGPLQVEVITFDNGVKLSLFANDAESGKVRVNVRFGRGLQALSPTDQKPSWAAPYVLPANGIGKLGQSALDQLTNGRRLGFEFGIDEDAFELSALTRPADYRDQLRLFAAKLAKPGWDPVPLERMKSALLAAYDASDTSPNSVIGRDLGWLLRDKDARYRTPDKAEIAATTPKAFRKLWKPLLRSGPIEVQIFGDVKADEAIAAVAASFGALPRRTVGKVAAQADQVRFPPHNATPLLLSHRGDADQAAAAIAWPTGAGLANVREARQLDVLAQIISDRLFEKLRAVDGASYSPNAISNWSFGIPKGQGYLLVTSQLKPDKVVYFYTLMGEIAADLAARPVSEDEMTRTVAPMRQMLARASTGNAFWMNLLEGATRDARYVQASSSIGRDLVSVTPASLQALSRKYLVDNNSYSVVVMPQKGK